jgi:hypothetical protein
MTPDLFADDSHNWFVPSPARRPRAGTASAASSTPLTLHQHIGFQLGWDHARHGVTPPRPHALEPSPLQQGWHAGLACFGGHRTAPRRAVRQWLQLRLHAWLRGLNVELLHITPNHLHQIEVSVCPITREALGHAGEPAAAASINRVRHDAGYAAGNLAVMSQRAHLAKAAHGFGTAWATAQALQALDQAADAAGPATRDGLSAAHWSRLAVLCSFVEALPHQQACELPLRLLPPNRLRLFNPAQALQVFISRQLLSAGWSQRINALEALLPGLPAQRAFRSFFQTLLPRVLEAKGSIGAQESRWALEDAWAHPAVLQRWTRFAQPLTPAECEALMQQSTAGHIAPEGVRFEPQADVHATEGWCLETHGHVPHELAGDALGPRLAAGAHTLH